MPIEDFENKKKTFWSKEEAVLNIERYCVTQDRCHKEVRYKLIERGIYGDLLEEMISELISNNFLDEERFARSFARGKFKIKNWGRNKIKNELKFRDISPYCIKEAMTEINENDYLLTLEKLIEKKERTLKFNNQYERIKKLTDFAILKGYEYQLIRDIIQ